VVAFIVSVVVTALMCAITAYVAWLRPQDQRLTWGEAMLGSTWFFMILLLMFGIVPDRFIRWADGELGWSTDVFFYDDGTHEFLGTFIRFDIHMQAVRDIIVVLIHLVFLVLLPPAILFWQKRGPARSWGAPKVEEEPVSDFGRPLVREGV
jgi:hypothetical protein